MMITTEEAKEKKVSGFDVYRSDHIFYVSSLNRDCGVWQLCEQAYFLFMDADFIKYRNQRIQEASEWREFLESGKSIVDGNLPPSDYGLLLLSRRFLDSFKIGSAFEISLKARLLSKGYVVHRIDTNNPLSVKQKKQPVEITEFIASAQPFHDGERNFYPDLTDLTLGFETLLKKEAYKTALNLSHDEYVFIDELRQKRNLMHLPFGGEVVKTPYIESLGEKYHEHLLSHVNKFIIDLYNSCNPKFGPIKKLS